MPESPAGTGSTEAGGTPGELPTPAGGTAVSSLAGSGGGSSTGGSAGGGGAGVTKLPLIPGYEVTGSWPEQPTVIAPQPGSLTYTKVVLHDRFLAESCSIGDYNNDGEPDVSSGRRWYEGPFGPDLPIVEHVFRGGHDDLPRAGLGPELVTGVSDSWSSFAYDMDGDGWTDIINIASPEADETQTPSPMPLPQAHATAYWYKNPGEAGADGMWQAYLMHDDVRGEQHGLADVDGDGRPEIFGACKLCDPGETKGYYAGNWQRPSERWSFRSVTTRVEFPYGGTGLLSGFGVGDVNADAKPDFLERNGVWLDALAPAANVTAFVGVPFYGSATTEHYGPSHMYAFDVDGDGDGDIVAAENSKAYGVSWWEQTAERTFVKHPIVGSPVSESLTGLVFSSPTALQVADMNGDGLLDVVTGKMRFPLPDGCGIPDLMGDPVSYVFKLVRGAVDAPGQVTFEAHPIDTDSAGAKAGIGRQIAVGHANTDGIMDVCVASKLGLYLYLGQ